MAFYPGTVELPTQKQPSPWSAEMRALVAWSGGKDAAWALHLSRLQGVQVAGLLTTMAGDRVAMHDVRGALVEAQAAAAGLPLWKVPLPWPCPNVEYESAMRAHLARARGDGIEAVVFGDLFLADIRAYRESLLAGTGVRPLFPLWGGDTAALAREMLAGGLRATIVCVDLGKLPAGFAGRDFDEALPSETSGELAEIDAHDGRPQPSREHLARQCGRIPAPEREQRAHPGPGEQGLAVCADVGQEQVAEDDRLDPVAAGPRKVCPHRRLVLDVGAWPREGHFPQRQSGGGRLCLDERPPNVVHRHAISGHGGQEPRHLDALQAREVQRPGGVLASAPSDQCAHFSRPR